MSMVLSFGQMQQAFQSLMGAVLVNESVYMPVNHYLLPLMWNHRALFSELWVDPDAEGDGGRAGSRQRHTMKILFKMDPAAGPVRYHSEQPWE